MEIIAQVASLALLVLSTVLGVKFRKYKGLLKKVIAALDDGKVTKEEVRGIITYWTDGDM